MYKAWLDGLRAIAVIGVIFNHIWPETWSGGYLGVDIFFVISGFIVSLSSMDKVERYLSFSKYIFVIDFISRRLKRLYPSLLVCVLICITIGSMVIYPFSGEKGSSYMTAIFSIIGASNFYLALKPVDYFNPTSELNLFLHTWSLSAEMQYYIIFPVIFVLCRFKHKILLIVWSFLSLISFILQWRSIYIIKDFNFGFYLLPSRLWELSVGVIIFLLCSYIMRLNNSSVTVLRYFGIASIVSLGFFFYLLNEQNLMLNTSLTVFSSACILVIATRDRIIQRILSSSLLVFIGKRSYSIYLWHWPLIILAKWTIGIDLYTSLLLLLLIFIVSLLFFRVIENPLRYHLNLSSLNTILLSMCCALSTILLMLFLNGVHISSLLWLGIRKPGVFFTPKSFPHMPFLPYIRGTTITRKNCFDYFSFTPDSRLDLDNFDRCNYSSGSKHSRTIYLYGDSFAAHLSPTVFDVAVKNNFSIEIVSRARCPFPSRAISIHNDCHLFSIKRFNRLIRHAKKGDFLIISNSNNEPGNSFSEHFTSQLAQITDKLHEIGVKVIYQSPTPQFTNSYNPVCLYPLQWFQYRLYSKCSKESFVLRQKEINRIAHMKWQLQHISSSDPLILWDVFDTVCPSKFVYCSTHDTGERMYRDDIHFSIYSVRILSPSLLKLVSPIKNS